MTRTRGRGSGSRRSGARRTGARSSGEARGATGGRHPAIEDARWRDFAETSSDWFWETDQEFRFIYASAKLGESRTWYEKEFLGKTPWEFVGVDPDTEPAWRDLIQEVRARRPFRDFRYGANDLNGRRRHWRVSGKPYFDEAGTFLGYRGTGTEETANVEALVRADSAESRLAGIATNLPGIIFRRVIEPDGRVRFTYLSPKVKELFGIDPEVAVSDPERLIGIIHRDDVGPWREALRDSAARLSVFEFENRICPSNGRMRWMRTVAHPHRREDGAVVWDGIALDVTARKRAEQQLAENSSVLEATLEHMSQGISVADPDLRLVAFNRRFLELLGFPPEQFRPGDPFENFIRYNAERGEYGPGDPDDQVRERVELAKRFEPHRFERTRQDGTVLEIAGEPVPGGGFVTTYTDVTEERHAQKILQGRNRVLELLAQGASLDEVLDALAQTAEEIIPGALCSVLILDQDKKCLLRGAAPSLPAFLSEAIDGLPVGPNVASCGAAAHSGKRVIVEDVVSHPNWAGFQDLAERAGIRACWSEPIVGAAGQVLGTLALSHREVRRPRRPELDYLETTAHLAGIAIERTQAEAARRESEQRFRDVAEVASDWFWEMDADLHFSYFSSRFAEQTGLDPAELIGKTRLDLVKPEPDDTDWQSHLQDLKQRKPFRDFRYVVETSKVSTRHWSISGKPVFDEDGSFIGYRGTGTDVTVEAEAQHTRRLLSDAVEALADGFVIFDSGHRMVLCNRRYREIYHEIADILVPGAALEEITRRAIRECI
ncbi:MAG: PAS-domain containing protein, partial [Alphaproteobacteria bacterium]|nr:PAS-domain containing protein [Alphaproteobacteria bacterium]